MDIIKYDEKIFTKTGLNLPESLTFEDWLSLGNKLKIIKNASLWWWADYINFGQRKYGEMYAQALDETDYSYQTLADATYTARKFDISCRHENVPLSFHKEVAPLEPDIQNKLLSKCEEEKWTRRELRDEVHKAQRQLKEVNLPDNRFRIFYADPPWQYNDKCEDGAIQSGGADKHYPTMSIEELCAMPIKDISLDDAVLFLWTTSPLLEDSFKVINSWGFKYKTSFVWDKVKHNMGHYNSVRHELLLICTKGSCQPDNIKLFDSVQVIEKSNIHSQKPEEFYNIIETLYTHGNRIELFARNKRNGWDSYGNEL